MSSFTIQRMSRAELDLGVDWAAAEGWNPGLHDACSFHAADADGFLLGRLGDEPVGMISAVRYGRGFGFVGFYIVLPAYRGHGYGLALWQAAMQRLRGRLAGLDGVVAQQANYRRSGFELAWNNVRHEGVPARATVPDPDVLPLAALPFDELQRYDAAFFPDDRTAFLRAWISQPGSVGLAVRHGGRLAGYGVVRPCRNGFKVGPLFADADELADRLLRALAAQVPEGARVQLDIPAINPAAVALVAAHGLKPAFETARMYDGPAPALPIRRLYGVTTFELG